MTSASAVARYIVRFFQDAGDPVSNLKLQKLLYYVQGWHLALLGKPAFPDRFEAWVHGPVQPATYGNYKAYRWSPITAELPVPEIPDETVEVIKSVLETYGGDGGYQLELRTHQEAPWLVARGALSPDQESSAIITHESMKAFFTGLLNDGKAQQG